MRNISRPKGWVKADAVRVIKNKGKWTVQIRRKPKAKPRRKSKNPSARLRKKKSLGPRGKTWKDYERKERAKITSSFGGKRTRSRKTHKPRF